MFKSFNLEILHDGFLIFPWKNKWWLHVHMWWTQFFPIPLEGFQAGKESGSSVVTPTGTLRAKFHIEIDGYSWYVY